MRILSQIAVFALLLVLKVNSLTAKQYLNNIITLFNDGEYEAIYNTFASKYKTAKVKAELIQNLTLIKKFHGEVLTNITVSTSTNSILSMVSFADDLTIGYALAMVKNGKPHLAYIQAEELTSIVDGLKNQYQTIGFKFKFDDETIEKYSEEKFRVGGLQSFPITVEVQNQSNNQFCNQLAQGKIKGSKVVERAELQKYYVSGYDKNFNRFSINISSSQTLQSLVIQNMKTPSLAVTEYLFELLGMENIENTMDALGISQDRTMYPASFLVQLGQISLTYENQNEFSSQITYHTSDSKIIEENLRIHQILKTGNSTAKSLLRKTISAILASNEVIKMFNSMNAVGTAEDYANAFQSFMNKDFELDGDTNTIYRNFFNLKIIQSQTKMFGSGTQIGLSVSTLDELTEKYYYKAMSGYVTPKKASYKSLAYCVLQYQYGREDEQFQKIFDLFVFHLLASPEYRKAAADLL